MIYSSVPNVKCLLDDSGFIQYVNHTHFRVSPVPEVVTAAPAMSAAVAVTQSVTASSKNATFADQYELVTKVGKKRFAELATAALQTTADSVGDAYMERIKSVMKLRFAFLITQNWDRLLEDHGGYRRVAPKKLSVHIMHMFDPQRIV